MKTFRRNTLEEVKAEILSLQLPGVYEVDNGIGAYEYWGAKGVDHQIDGEVEELEDVKIELHFQLAGTKPYVTDPHFPGFIEEILLDIDDAVFEVEEKAKRKVALDADDAGKKDYSDIIKLSYTTSIELKANSTEVWKIVFTFSWIDAREE
jgi:hypothetical protein